MRFLFWMNLNEHVVLPILKWGTVLSKDWIPVIVVKLLPVLHVHVIVDRGVGGADHHLVPVVLLHLQLLLLLVAEDVVDAVGDDVSEGVAGADGSGATVGIWHEWILLNIASRFSINIATTDKMKIVKMMIRKMSTLTMNMRWRQFLVSDHTWLHHILTHSRVSPGHETDQCQDPDTLQSCLEHIN